MAPLGLPQWPCPEPPKPDGMVAAGMAMEVGAAIGFGAPYYGGYYGGPYYTCGGDCVMRRRWVINRGGHRVLRWTRVCY